MIDALIARYRDPSPDVSEAAEKELRTLARSGTLSLDDAAALLRAATGELPPPKHEWQDPASPLVYASEAIVRDKDAARLLPVVVETFDRLSPSARNAALRIVVLAGTPGSADLYATLLERHAEGLDDGMVPQYNPDAGPEVADRLFPRLLDTARHIQVAYPVLHMLLEFRNAGLLSPDVAARHQGSLAGVLRAEVEQARALQRPEGLGWKDEPPYADHRDMIGLLFDLAGTLSPGPLAGVMEESGDLADPRLRRFRAVSLLRLGREVPATELEWIARSPRDRYWLFEQFHRLGMPERLPEACLDQAKLAEGHMVDWLCFGTELGREPDEIELIHVETRRRSESHLLVRWLAKRRPVDYYFFRYRVTEEHWSKQKGWMVGMAGGYARDEQPTTCHDGGTFSKFNAYEEKSLAEHVADYLD